MESQSFPSFKYQSPLKNLSLPTASNSQLADWYTKPLSDIEIDFENTIHLMHVHGRYYELSERQK